MSTSEFEVTDEMVEQAAAVAHDAYLHECYVQKKLVKPECAPQYANLTEDMKAFDRRMAMYVIDFVAPLIRAEGYRQGVEAAKQIAKRHSDDMKSIADSLLDRNMMAARLLLHLGCCERKIADEIEALSNPPDASTRGHDG